MRTNVLFWRVKQCLITRNELRVIDKHDKVICIYINHITDIKYT